MCALWFGLSFRLPSQHDGNLIRTFTCPAGAAVAHLRLPRAAAPLARPRDHLRALWSGRVVVPRDDLQPRRIRLDRTQVLVHAPVVEVAGHRLDEGPVPVHGRASSTPPCRPSVAVVPARRREDQVEKAFVDLLPKKRCRCALPGRARIHDRVVGLLDGGSRIRYGSARSPTQTAPRAAPCRW